MNRRDDEYDVVVIGGGIYGLMLTLESIRLGKRVALVERSKFGSGTTSGWLRILHGGLRYLQSADLVRFFESVHERRWFLRFLGEYAEPLPCVMPLYDTHSHSKWKMGAGLLANDLLSAHRNIGVPSRCHLPGSRIIGPDEARTVLPFIETTGLIGAASWSDAVVRRPQRLLQALIAHCRRHGARLLASAEVVELMTANGSVNGVVARQANTSSTFPIFASTVFNATGHDAPQLLQNFGLPVVAAPKYSWAWNVLFNVPNPGRHAAAVSARRRDSQVLFMLPWLGRMLVGTGHALIPDGVSNDDVPAQLIRNFIADADAAAPSLGLREANVARVFSGKLPAHASDSVSLTSRPWVVDHAVHEAKGLVSVWGVKYTTARRVAERLVRQAFNEPASRAKTYEEIKGELSASDHDQALHRAVDSGSLSTEQVREFLRSCSANAEDHLDDLLLNRSSIADIPSHAMALAQPIGEVLGWHPTRLKEETLGLSRALKQCGS